MGDSLVFQPFQQSGGTLASRPQREQDSFMDPEPRYYFVEFTIAATAANVGTPQKRAHLLVEGKLDDLVKQNSAFLDLSKEDQWKVGRDYAVNQASEVAHHHYKTNWQAVVTTTVRPAINKSNLSSDTVIPLPDGGRVWILVETTN